MDREQIKKYSKEFNAWINGESVELQYAICGQFFALGDKLPENFIALRIKPEVVHYYEGCNTVWSKYDRITQDKSKVTCPDCLAKMCKYPGLRQAIIDRKEFFVKVTPEQSEEVENIFVELKIPNAINDEFCSELILFNRHYYFHVPKKYDIGKTPELYLSTDSFNAPIPSWIKVGEKCFRENDKQIYVIVEIEDNIIYCNDINGQLQFSTPFPELLSPAILRYPTIEELEMLVPFGVRSISNGGVTTIYEVNNSGIKIAGLGYVSYKEFFTLFTKPNKTEFGEWVKA